MTKNVNQLLVIDDEPLICGFINTVGQQMGLGVTTTSDPDEFYRSFESGQPSIVILDLQMPKVDGVELLRFLADNKCKSSIILVSGVHMKTLASAENLGIAKGLDMCGVLQKPIRVEALRKTLELTLKNRQQISPDSLREAIKAEQLEVHFQPISTRDDAGDWKITGAEALVRWQHPEYGQIMPQHFIGLAEENDLIMPLTEYVLRDSIKAHARWQKAGREISVSVNLSPVLLTKTQFPEVLGRLFSDCESDITDFTLELTEGATARDVEVAMDILTRLRLKGVGLSIDDFGTGYSSLEQLFLMPFNELKVDRSFVSRMQHSSAAQKMVKVIIYLAHELGMSCCAEGVEDEETLRLLEEYECDRIQGFLISKAVKSDQFLESADAWDSRKPVHASALPPAPGLLIRC